MPDSPHKAASATPPLHATPDVGYSVELAPVSTYDGMSVSYRWRVEITRLSDREFVAVEFRSRWRARRFGLSPRRMGKAFERKRELKHLDQVEQWIVEV